MIGRLTVKQFNVMTVDKINFCCFLFTITHHEEVNFKFSGSFKTSCTRLTKVATIIADRVR